ncbi:MAG: YciI-like protein [Bacteroidota bacterium]
MYYILFYKTVENYVEKRAPYRTNHLAHAQEAYDRGEIVMAGALDEPADSAILIFRDDAAARSFAENDPYVQNGLITSWEVRPWKVVVGN